MNVRGGLLSGGEQQMLTLARALARKPRVLLADELSMGLAPLVVKRLLEAVRAAADELGRAVLLVEQHVRKALKYADRAYVMRRGRIELSGTAGELRSKHRRDRRPVPLVARLIWTSTSPPHGCRRHLTSRYGAGSLGVAVEPSGAGAAHESKGAFAHEDEGRCPVGAADHGASRRSSSTRPRAGGAGQAHRLRAVPLRRALGHRRRALPQEAQDEMGMQQFPVIGGHEGAGTVVEVGAGRQGSRARRPRRVRLHPVVRQVPVVRDRAPEPVRPRRLPARRPPGHRLHGSPPRPGPRPRDDVLHRHVRRVHRRLRGRCIKIDDDIPLDKAALVGCGVTTGWGCAVYAAEVRAGETVVVIGCGGIGMNAVQGAAIAGRPSRHRRRPARVQAGAGADLRGDPLGRRRWRRLTALVSELTWGAMAEKAIITIDVAEGEYVQQALGLVGKGGPGRADRHRPVHRRQRQHEPVRADDVREAAPRLDLRLRQPPPRHPPPAAPLPEGQLKLDELVTTTYPIKDINDGYQDMLDGSNIRGMLIYDHGGNGS